VGIRVGNWLSMSQAQSLLNAPDVTTLGGLRDRAILAVLLGCGLRRSEVAALTVSGHRLRHPGGAIRLVHSRETGSGEKGSHDRSPLRATHRRPQSDDLSNSPRFLICESKLNNFSPVEIHVVARLRLTGTHKGAFAGVAPTNKSISWQACNVVELRNGKAIRSRVYADNASMFRQLGVGNHN